MTTKNTEGLERKQQHSAVFICPPLHVHYSSFTIISSKELIRLERTIKTIFPSFNVKPNPPSDQPLPRCNAAETGVGKTLSPVEVSRSSQLRNQKTTRGGSPLPEATSYTPPQKSHNEFMGNKAPDEPGVGGEELTLAFCFS